MYESKTDPSTESLLRVYHRLLKEIGNKLNELQELNIKASSLSTQKKKITAENMKLQETDFEELNSNILNFDENDLEKEDLKLSQLISICEGKTKIEITNFDIENQKVDILWKINPNDEPLRFRFDVAKDVLDCSLDEKGNPIQKEDFDTKVIPVINQLSERKPSWYESKCYLLNHLHEFYESN